MAKLTLSEAARACNVARTTIKRAVKTGRLSLDADHCVDTAELLRVGYHLDAAVLHAAAQHPPVSMQQDAAPINAAGRPAAQHAADDAAAADAGAADAARDAAPLRPPPRHPTSEPPGCPRTRAGPPACGGNSQHAD